MTHEKMNSGISAFRNGNKKIASQLFSEIVKSEPNNEHAWLWLAASIDNLEQKEFCFKKVLSINPENENAKKALLQIKQPSAPSFDDLINNSPANNGSDAKKNHIVTNPSKMEVQALKCPMCGGNISPHERECSYCGSTLIITSIEKTNSNRPDNQIFSTSTNNWKSILRTDPNDPDANYALGLSYLNQKLRDAALQYLQKASLLMPEVAIVHYNLALTLFNDGNINLDSADYANAIKAIDYASRLDPNFKEAKAFKHFFTARKLDGVNYSEAIKEYKTAIDTCPDVATFHNNLGLAYYQTKNYGAAEKSYLKAIDLDAEYILAYSNLALLCFTTGKYQDGVRYGGRAVELLRPTTIEASQAMAYNNYSLCLWKTGQNKKAIEIISKAIALSPNEPIYQTNLKLYKGGDVAITLAVLFGLFICFMLFMWIIS